MAYLYPDQVIVPMRDCPIRVIVSIREQHCLKCLIDEFNKQHYQINWRTEAKQIYDHIVKNMVHLVDDNEIEIYF